MLAWTTSGGWGFGGPKSSRSSFDIGQLVYFDIGRLFLGQDLQCVGAVFDVSVGDGR